jgi:NitT/TauT family transport system ATP-binding protein
MDKIHIAGLEKTYASKGGRVAALAHVDLTIRQNEFITLVGPSGCGKSTLLKLIGGLIRPSRGLLLHDSVALTRPPRDVGIVFQEAVLLQWRSVLGKKSLTSLVMERGVGCLERRKLFVALWRVR